MAKGTDKTRRLTMKEKPGSTEAPSTRKCLPRGMLVTARLTLAGPAACVPGGCSSHANSSMKPFQDMGLEPRELKVSQRAHRPGCMPTAGSRAGAALSAP